MPRPARVFAQVMAHSDHIAKSSADEALIARLRQEEPGAAEALVDRHGGWIHRVVSRLLDDPRDAEEATQDVLLTVVRKIALFRGEAAFSSWLYRIAVNTAYTRLRSRRARAEVALEPILSEFDDEGRHVKPAVDWSDRLKNPAVAGELRAALELGIGRLPEDYRAVLLLRDVEGLSTGQVAEATGLTIAAAKSRLHRARLSLRADLARVFP